MLCFGEIWHFNDGCTVAYSTGQCERNGKSEVQREIFHMQKNKMKYSCFGHLWSKAMRRSIITDNGLRFDESLDIIEDEIFCLAYSLHTLSLKTISTPLYHYEFRENGLVAHAKPEPSVWIAVAKGLGQYARKMECDELRAFYLNDSLSGHIEAAIYLEKNIFKRLSIMLSTFKICRQEQIKYPIKSIIKRTARGMLNFVTGSHW